jgi:NADH dehydrogenase
MPVLVTGANGNLGRALFRQIASPDRFRAGVRSARAAAQVEALDAAVRPEIVRVDYADEQSMFEASNGCEAIVHLVGIIKEAAGTSYADAHERSCAVLSRAAARAGAKRIVYLSIVGATPGSANACLASKGAAERILLDGPVAATVLRVPMVLGRGDYAAAALRAQASGGRAMLVGGGRTLQQPIDARDVVRAIDASARDTSPDSVALDLGGPECLPHRELVARAAAALGRPAPRIGGLPLFAARVFAALVGRLLPNPPITSAMLGVLQHDDRVDSAAACAHLGIELTPLDDTLAHCLRDGVETA